MILMIWESSQFQGLSINMYQVLCVVCVGWMSCGHNYINLVALFGNLPLMCVFKLLQLAANFACGEGRPGIEAIHLYACHDSTCKYIS